jgi:pimeloyl-ACP methyl ester carboxylesterase
MSGIVARALRAAALGAALLLAVLAVLLVVGNALTGASDIDEVAYARDRLQLDTPVESSLIETNGIRLHVVAAGPSSGPPVFLLHGHPDFWWGWNRQIPALAAAGFRVVAPDLRGFNRSDKPLDIAAYRREYVANDIRGLIEALGYGSVYVVGHDSGAAIGWELVMRHPDQVRGFVSLAVGHPEAYRRAARMPLYARIIRLDGLVESGGLRLLLRPFNWLPLTLGLRSFGRFEESELDLYRASWSREDAITRMFFWTLAENRPTPTEHVDSPVLIVVVPDDPGIPPQPARESTRFANVQLREIAGVGHWVQRDAPEETNRLLIEFVRSAERASPPDAAAAASAARWRMIVRH